MIPLALGILACLAWVYLLLGRGGFWRSAERDDGPSFEMGDDLPRVAAIIPARDESACIGDAIASLLGQDYAGELLIVVVDDHSTDDTAGAARAAAGAASERLTVLAAPPLAAGWTGKLSALREGVRHAVAAPRPPDYLLLTDADIVYAPDTVGRLVARASSGRLVLASLMARLRCVSPAERAFIPSFIFFFEMLYPFRWVNDPGSRTAAAAGGCMLVQRLALEAAGGLEAVRSTLIDDCALARVLKRQGPVWLGLTQRVRSARSYDTLGEIRRMVSRCAYAQLRFSPGLLALTVLAMGVVYAAPAAFALFGSGAAQWLGVLALALMALALQPTLRFYGLGPWWGLALPAIAVAYMLFTLDSAWQHWRGRGGLWKGRVYRDSSAHEMTDH
ncbi:MAG TPA: glycosyltransferase [Casimicrobiaceae bacterium]|nr:glycosyltransferase [Casimicrobiaceae bacterium]